MPYRTDVRFLSHPGQGGRGEEMNRKKVSFLFGILLAALAAVIIILVCSIHGSADSEGGLTPECSYRSVEVHRGDTLWSISEEYAKSYHCETREYIREIKKINRLTSDRINEGMSLIVVVYE